MLVCNVTTPTKAGNEKKTTTANEIFEFLSFLENKQAVQEVINRFLNDGLMIADPDGLAITPKGVQVFEEVSMLQEEVKEKAFQGINEEAYATTIDTLQKIIDNLSDYLPEEAITTNDLSAGPT